MKQEKMTPKDYALIAGGGIVLSVGGALLIRHFIRNAIQNKQQTLSFQDGTPASWAKQLEMGFDNDGWPGTDVPVVRYVMRTIPSKEVFDKVKQSYQKMYGKNLIREMTSELTTTEYNEMMQIVAAKPAKDGQVVSVNTMAEGWATRLKVAMDYTVGPFPETDEDAIRSVLLEIPSKSAWEATKMAYMNKYGQNLLNDLRSDLDWWEYSEMTEIINSKS